MSCKTGCEASTRDAERAVRNGAAGSRSRRATAAFALLLALVGAQPADAQVLDKQALLDRQTFWDNRDWDWYKAQIPFFDSPDEAINTTYYYRWELLTKHLTYGSPASGYTFTEFIDRPPWSGTYGAISCPAGHQLYEARWLRDPRIPRDFARYWFETPGAQPRRYSTWLADALWALHRVHPDRGFAVGLLPALKLNYENWERERFTPEVGLFWQTGHDDGMETNINSRQTKDWFRGAPGYRPTLNSYLWADAHAIARVAELAGDQAAADVYRAKADALKRTMQRLLWDPKRAFFFPMAKNDEVKDGHTVQAGSLTYQTGEFAGNPHGREEIGFVPWQFGLPDAGYESAWKCLMDRNAFLSDFGPTTTERRDPLFAISKYCCVWSGQSWPYATTQTLQALANLVRDTPQKVVSKADYFKLLSIYTRTQRKGDRPYIAEAANPDTGSWDGHDTYNHSEHYFHSGYVDLVINGLAGLRPRDDDVLEVDPLAPEDWAYFALDDVMYKGRALSVVWDRDGSRYRLGAGLHLVVDGKTVASRARLGKLVAALPAAGPRVETTPRANFAVNNDGGYFPRATASHTGRGTSVGKLVDGVFWYHRSPPNRWTSAGSASNRDEVEINFGVERAIDEVKLYFLDDGGAIKPPKSYELLYWKDAAWHAIPAQNRTAAAPTGRRANVVKFDALKTSKILARFEHDGAARTGLSEFEAWGDGAQSKAPAPPPRGNLAYKGDNRPFPRVSASFTSMFDDIARANDGVVNFSPNPPNRWTSFGSPHKTDWLEVDFGARRSVARVELAIFDDGGGVRAPIAYNVEYWDGTAWRDAPGQAKLPAEPVGGQYNEVRFDRIAASKLRVVFTHRGESRSGISEILVWSR